MIIIVGSLELPLTSRKISNKKWRKRKKERH